MLYEKCDEAHPTCYNCAKGNRTCEYKTQGPPPPINTANIFITNPQSYELALAQGKSPVSAYYNPPQTPKLKKLSVASSSSTSTSKTSISSASSQSSNNSSFAVNSQFIQHSFPQQLSFSSFPVSQSQSHEKYQQQHQPSKLQYIEQPTQRPVLHPQPLPGYPIIPHQHHVSQQQVQNLQQQGYPSPAPQNSFIIDYNTYNYQQYYTPVFNTVVTSTSHPNWPIKFQELIKHYQDQSFSFTPSFPYSQYLWRDYALGLSVKHPFLGIAICTFSSLHLDSTAQAFSPSLLSLELYEKTVAQCSAVCVDKTNFEAVYFATSLIWLCSYRLLKMVPFYRQAQDLNSPTDIMSLYKGPYSILISFKGLLSSSPLSKLMIGIGNEFENNPLMLAPVNILDDLLNLSHLITNSNMPFSEPIDIPRFIEIIRAGQHSSPSMDEIFLTNSNGGALESSGYYQPFVAYYQAINSLKNCVRQAIALNDLSKLHEWPQTVNTDYLALLRAYEHNPFALVVINYFLAMLLFMSHPSVFWLHDRLIYEIRHISQQLPEPSWTAVLEWPNTVLHTVEIQQMKGEPLGIQTFKQMVQYRL